MPLHVALLLTANLLQCYSYYCQCKSVCKLKHAVGNCSLLGWGSNNRQLWLWFFTLIVRNIRILHGCEVGIENSILRVTCFASRSFAKQRSRGTEFSICTKHSCLILFLAYLSIFNVSFITTHNDVEVRHF